MTEAARLLGITPEAVRQRIRRGTIRAEMINGRWSITVPEDELTMPEVTHRSTAQLERAIEAQSSHIKSLSSEVARLRGLIEDLLDAEKRRPDDALSRARHDTRGEDSGPSSEQSTVTTRKKRKKGKKV